MARRSTLVLVLAAAALVSACTSQGATAPPTATLTGHTYLSTGIQGAALVPSTQIRLTFTDGNLTASAGCNMMGGTYSVEAGRLKTSQMFMTEMACDDARQGQDEWLARFLGNVAIELDADTLTLTGDTITLSLLDKEVATPDLPLEGTRWVLDGIVSGDAVSSVPTGVQATIFVHDGGADLEAGCNGGGGTVAISPDTITFGPIALEKMACEPAAMAVEDAVTAVLNGTVAYTIDADVLTLKSADRGLSFRAAR